MSSFDELSSSIFNAERIYNCALEILQDVSIRQDIIDGYKRLKDKLGKPGVTDRASKYILDSVSH